jgi:hypothetical protein
MSIFDETGNEALYTYLKLCSKHVDINMEFSHRLAVNTGKEISKLFNETLKCNGFEKVKTNCWNNRPAYWRLK